MVAIEDIPALGVGIVYFSELAQLRNVDLTAYDVLEIEPETFWAIDPSGNLAANTGKLSEVATLANACLVHSVGLSVGNALTPSAQTLELLAKNVRLLSSPYASEHLSFNCIGKPPDERWTGFLLPPPQTLDGVALAVDQLHRFRDALGVPVAFETGVNYFQPRAGDLGDGEFFAMVAESADCGILLDLHNLFTNERNGRVTVERVLESLPLERVWEVHVAGGHFHRGFYLDAHDGLTSPELRKLTERVVPRLPNLRAIVFEAQPDSMRSVTRSAHDDQRAWLQKMWEQRGTRAKRARPHTAMAPLPDVGAARARVNAYENDLHDRIASADAMSDERDAAACCLLRELTGEVRGGMLLRSVPLVTRLLLSTLGKPAFRQFLARYCAAEPPAMFPILEGAHFLAFVEREAADVPYVRQLIDFEQALLNVVATGRSCRLPFPYNPAELLSALAHRSRPSVTDWQPYEVEISAKAVTLRKITA
jgi:uncharacterized protein